MNKKLLNLFKKFNEKYWKGTLPIPELIMSSKLGKDLGEYEYESYIGCRDYVIRISSKLNSKEIRDTLLHEMCHHAVYIKYRSRHYSKSKKNKVYPHGKEWVKEMRKCGFKKRVNRFT